jgi:hypothetical protein
MYRKPFDMLVEGNENEKWLGGRDSCPFDEAQGESNAPEALTSSHEGAKRLKWLGGRDSNPDNLVQSQVSYR